MKPLLIIPLPCDGARVFALVDQVTKEWQADHGRALTTAHLESRDSEFGHVLVVWDEIPDRMRRVAS